MIMAEIHQSGEDYLEAILIIANKGIPVRSIDIVHEMNVSKPSVSRAMGILKEKGLIKVDTLGAITLTEEGLKLAEGVYEKHRVLTNWLISLGVSKDVAAEDACKMEHYISNESFDKLKEFIAKQG
jgi:Mn-dependent DtxR family transcriptional regulator